MISVPGKHGILLPGFTHAATRLASCALVLTLSCLAAGDNQHLFLGELKTPNMGQARGSLSPHGTNNRDKAMSEVWVGSQWVLTKQSAEHKDLLGKASCLVGQLQGRGCGGLSLSCCHFAVPSRTETQRGTWQHELPAQPFQKAAAWRGPAQAGNRTFIPCIQPDTALVLQGNAGYQS